MELMTIIDAMDLINKIKCFNMGDVKYTKIHACSGKPIRFTDFENEVTRMSYKIRRDEWDKSCVLIDGHPLLKEWDRLDVDTINVHAPLNVIKFEIDED